MSETPRSFALSTGLCAALLALAPVVRADASEFECLIEPSMVVEVASANAGVLDEVAVDRGARVESDQVVARLQSDVERATVKLARKRANLAAAIAAANEQLEFERKEVERRRALHENRRVSERELQESETQLRLAQLRREELDENRELARMELERTEVILDLRSVRSPIDGVVVERYHSPGEYVEDQPILKLAAVSPLHVEVVLPVGMLGSVEVGTLAEVFPEEPVGGRYSARVSVVDAVIDAATSTFGVRLELPNEDGDLPAGLRCRLRFLDSAREEALPRPAPVERQDENAS